MSTPQGNHPRPLEGSAPSVPHAPNPHGPTLDPTDVEPIVFADPKTIREPAGPLVYATDEPAGRPGRLALVARRATLVLFFVAAGLFAVAWGWRVWRQSRYLAVQARSMSYLAPAQAVVLSPGVPLSRTRLPEADALFASVVADQHELGAVVFLHERANPHGEKRLVSVQLWRNDLASPALWVQAWIPAGAALASRARPAATARFDGLLKLPPSSTLLAGQPDPVDPTRFVIPVALDGRAGLIEGRVGNDDRVHLEFRRAGPTEPFAQSTDSPASDR